MNTVNIPRLDLGNNYINGDAAEDRKQFSDAIGKAFNETGFVTITNHGLSKALMEKLYHEVKKPISPCLKPQQIINMRYQDLAGQRGYTGKSKETAKGFKTPDLKEFWQIGQTVAPDSVLKDDYPDNVWVDELSDFNLTTTEVYKKLETAGRHLLRAIAVYLELPENYFDDQIHEGNSILRTLHYFPITNPSLNIRYFLLRYIREL